MPLWSQAIIEPPWSKDHTVVLQDHAHYDELAKQGGSNKIQRHKPLSFAAGHGRAAGISGVHEELHPGYDQIVSSVNDEDWREALKDGSRVVSVRDVKLGSPECV